MCPPSRRALEGGRRRTATTVTCDDPQGTTGRGLLELGEQRWETLPTVYVGAHPTFLLDDVTPHILYGTWGAAPDESMTAPSPPPSVTATVLTQARGQITAVFAGAQTVRISLFPKLGIGVFTSHSHFPMSCQSEHLHLRAVSVCPSDTDLES